MLVQRYCALCNKIRWLVAGKKVESFQGNRVGNLTGAYSRR